MTEKGKRAFETAIEIIAPVEEVWRALNRRGARPVASPGRSRR